MGAKPILAGRSSRFVPGRSFGWPRECQDAAVGKGNEVPRQRSVVGTAFGGRSLSRREAQGEPRAGPDAQPPVPQGAAHPRQGGRRGGTESVNPVDEQARAKAALTELFAETRNGDTPVIVERIVADIDNIVRIVRFPG